MGVTEKGRKAAEGVQQVGHWCSAVRWSDDDAARVLESLRLGLMEIPVGGQIGALAYYPKLARLSRASKVGLGRSGNVRVEVVESSSHGLVLRGTCSSVVAQNMPVYLG